MAGVARWQRCDFIAYSTFKPRLIRLLCCAGMIFAIFTTRGAAGGKGASGAATPEASECKGCQNGEKINILS
jgi:hypothetical protein